MIKLRFFLWFGLIFILTMVFVLLSAGTSTLSSNYLVDYLLVAFGQNQQVQTESTNAGIRGLKTPQDMYIDSKNNMVYISNRGVNLVSVIDGSNNKLVESLNVSKEELFTPVHISVNPNTMMLYASNDPFDIPTISVTDLRTNGVVANISLEDAAVDLVVNPNNNKIYVSDGKALTIINGSNNEIVKTIQLNLTKLVVNPNTNKIYAIAPSNNSIAVIDGNTNELMPDKIPVANDPFSIAVNPNVDMVYVVNKDANRVSVVNASTNDVTKNILVTSSLFDGFEPTESSILISPEIGSDIAVSPKGNKVYVADSGANLITVIDGSTNKIIKTIPVDRPDDIEINTANNLIYSISHLSDTASIIDGNTDRLIGGKPTLFKSAGIKIDDPISDYPNIAVNPNTNKIYVLLGNSKLSIIDGNTDKQMNITTLNSSAPCEIKVNPTANKLYAIGCFSDTVSVIDGNTDREVDTIYMEDLSSVDIDTTSGNLITFRGYSNPPRLSIMNISGHVVVNSTLNISGSDLVINPKIKVLHIVDSTIENKVTTIYLNKGYIDEIYVQDLPRGMAIDPNSAILYVVNHNSHTVSVIDEYTNDIIANVNVGTFPTGIAINPKTNKIYVANEHSNTVSVIDSSINSVVNNITVGDFPTGIAINPKTNKIYVVNTDSDTVSVIDGNTDKALVGAIFNINPPNSGRLICNSKEIVNTTYIRYAVGANVKCEAKANGGFVLSSWSGDMASNLEDKPETKFKALQFGNLTANFIAAPPPIQFTIPTETLIQILLIIVTAIVGWLIPSIVGWINKARQKNSIVTFMENINNADNIHRLEELRKKVSEQYAKGKISESNYDILNNRISYYIESHNKKSQTDIRNDTNRIKKYTSEGKPA